MSYSRRILSSLIWITFCTTTISAYTALIPRLQQNEFPVEITQQPQSQWGFPGASIQLRVEALGDPQNSPSFQWYKDDTALIDSATMTGSTSNALTFLALSSQDMGSYRVKVSSKEFETNSEPAQINVSSIQELIDSAAPGAILDLPQGITAEAGINITKDLTLIGHPENKTVIDAKGLDRAFHIRAGAHATLSRVIVQNGRTGWSPDGSGLDGGGILNEGWLTLDQCVVRGNATPYALDNIGSAGNGGGLCNLGHAWILSSQIYSNTASGFRESDPLTYDGMGGGIYNGGYLQVSNSQVAWNSIGVHVDYRQLPEMERDRVGDGGGIFNSTKGVLEIFLSEISTNITGARPLQGGANGGGIANHGNLLAANCRLGWNTSQSKVRLDTTGNGGGLANFAKTKIISSYIFGNFLSGEPDSFGTHLQGGGIYNEGELGIDQCLIETNYITGAHSVGGNGAGIFHKRGQLSLSHSQIKGCWLNGVGLGAGMYLGTGIIQLNAVLIADNFIIDGFNQTGSGGGLVNANAFVSMMNSRIERNFLRGGESLPSNGAGILNQGEMRITSSSIVGNRSEPAPFSFVGSGGGIYNSGKLSLDECCIAGNKSANNRISYIPFGGYGGGIYNSGLLNVTSCLLTENESGMALRKAPPEYLGSKIAPGGGIYNETNAILRITNSIIASNNTKLTGSISPDIFGPVSSLDHCLIQNTNGLGHVDFAEGNLFGLDPRLGELVQADNGQWIYPLLPDSPAIDKGRSLEGDNFDQRGFPRPSGLAFDIGAYEFECPELQISTSSPETIEVCEEDNVQICASVKGTVSGLQWYFNDQPLIGADQNCITIPSSSLQQAGTYFLTATNFCRSTTGSAVRLVVHPKPRIFDAPISLVFTQGLPFRLKSIVSPTNGLHLQWFKEDSVVEADQNSTLERKVAQPTDAGVYSIVASNSCGMATGLVANVTIRPDFEILRSPTNLTTDVGANAAFTVEVAGVPPFEFQWFLNDIPIPNANSSQLTLDKVDDVRSGFIHVQMTNGLGTVLRASCQLTVVERVREGDHEYEIPYGSPRIYHNGHLIEGERIALRGSNMVSMATSYPKGSIVYTLDGSEPNLLSKLYTEPVLLNQSVHMRAKAYKSDLSRNASREPLRIDILSALTAATDGGGVVHVEPPEGDYSSSNTVRLIAEPLPGWIFLDWLGDPNTTESTVHLTMNRDRKAKARFGTRLHKQVSGAGFVEVQPNLESYPYGSRVTVYGVPDRGHAFAFWAAGRNDPSMPLITAITEPDLVFLGVFSPITSPTNVTLTLLSSGRGSVTSNPALKIFPAGSEVTVTAVPQPGQSWIRWQTDDPEMIAPTLRLKLTNHLVLRAEFTSEPKLGISPPWVELNDVGMGLWVESEPGSALQLESSSDLMNWLPQLQFTNQLGAEQIRPPFDPNSLHNFYRVKRLRN